MFSCMHNYFLPMEISAHTPYNNVCMSMLMVCYLCSLYRTIWIMDYHSSIRSIVEYHISHAHCNGIAKDQEERLRPFQHCWGVGQELDTETVSPGGIGEGQGCIHAHVVYTSCQKNIIVTGLRSINQRREIGSGSSLWRHYGQFVLWRQTFDLDPCYTHLYGGKLIASP